MPFKLKPLVVSDAPRCATIYFAAFQNAHSLACWPRTPSIRAFWENMITVEIDEPHSHWLKAIDSDTGDIAAFCKWQEPKPGVWPDLDLPEWPEDADKALCDETFGAWAREKRNLMEGRGHWYLELVATDPKYQGKGAGSLLMQWGLDQADAGGWESYLEASPEGVPLYRKLGFREAGKIDTFINNERVKDTWYRNLFMIRQAKTGSG